MKLPNPSVNQMDSVMAKLADQGNLAESQKIFTQAIFKTRPGWTEYLRGMGRATGPAEVLGALMALQMVDMLLEEQEIGEEP